MALSSLRTSDFSDVPFSERLTADEEKEMARRIRTAEQRAREAIAGINEADDILMRRPDRAERTRAGAVDRQQCTAIASRPLPLTGAPRSEHHRAPGVALPKLFRPVAFA